MKTTFALRASFWICIVTGVLHASTSDCFASKAQKNTSQHPSVPPMPVVKCSDAQTTKSCDSFKQLLNAHDKDLLDAISKKPSYVCLRPNDDAFQIFSIEPPSTYRWKQPDSDGKQEQEWKVSAELTEYRDGLFYSYHAGRAYWTRWGDSEPNFEYSVTTGRQEGLKISIDGTEISLEYPFNNQSGGKTQYTLSIRRSTGRFVETYTVGTAPSTTYSGTCMIYR